MPHPSKYPPRPESPLKQNYPAPPPEERGVKFGAMYGTQQVQPSDYITEQELFDQGIAPHKDAEGNYLNNPLGYVIDPTRFTIGIRNDAGQWGQVDENGMFRPYNREELFAFGEAVTGYPVIIDGAEPDDPDRWLDFTIQGMDHTVDGVYTPVDGVWRIVINGRRDFDTQSQTAAHEIAHPLSVAIAGHPEFAAVLEANRDRLDQLATFVNAQPLEHYYEAEFLDEERFAEFMRQYIMNPHWVRKRFPDLVKVLIPLIYEVQGPDGPYQIVQNSGAFGNPIA